MNARSPRRAIAADAARSRRGSGTGDRRRPWRRNPWLWVAGAAVAVWLALGAVLAFRGGHQAPPADPAAASAAVELAQANSGGPVRVLRGSQHTVYHSDLPLPTVSVPRADGRYTVV